MIGELTFFVSLGIIMLFSACTITFVWFLTIILNSEKTGQKVTQKDRVLITGVFTLIIIGGVNLFYGTIVEDDKQQSEQILNNIHLRDYCQYLGVSGDDFAENCSHLVKIIPNGSHGSTWSWLKDPKSADLCAEIVGEGDDLFQRCIPELQSKGLFTSHLEMTNP